jgi:putative thioredoxin
VSKKEVFIFEVSEKNFDSAVIQNSHKIPVFVEFMGVWSAPCIQMSDEISDLAKEFAGQFIFAKVDTDEQPELLKQYGVENLPTLKVLINGEVVETKEGLLTQSELRDVLKTFDIYSITDDLRQQAREKHMQGESLAAIQLLTQAMQEDPSNTKVALDMSQVMLDLNELEQAKSLFNQLPDNAKDSDMGKSILGQLTFYELAEKTKGKFQLQQLLMTSPNDCDVHFDLAVCLVAEKDFEQAMDHLFQIMDLNKGYKDGAAREMIINVTIMLATNNPELSSSFRSRLSSISFS